MIPTVDFNNSVGLVRVGSQAFLLYLSIMYVLQKESMGDTLLFCKHADSFHNLWIFPTFSSQSCVSPACPVFLVVMNVLASQNLWSTLHELVQWGYIHVLICHDNVNSVHFQNETNEAIKKVTLLYNHLIIFHVCYSPQHPVGSQVNLCF